MRPKKRRYIRIKIKNSFCLCAKGVLSAMFGGDEEDRTLGLTDANRTLSQLSYVPTLL